ncbi:hypothetical protein AB0I77_36825 [Streptomyces sp. NPDC050619]|uniref:hypothetical protein n=1 Tax=Streptomyces sp. NPDC050619 TaxID=3157214 RepID=UPI003426A0AC
MVQAVVSVAERMHGSAEDVPDAVGWLLDEEFAFGEPHGSTGEFLGDLADAVAHQGTCTDSTVEAVPFMVELACDDDVPEGTRIVLLGDLLRLAVTGPASAVSLADRTAALGGTWQEGAADYLTRHAIGQALPRLIARWDDEGDAARFVLAALAAACGIRDVPAPARLLAGNRTALSDAVSRVSSWLPQAAERAASPHVAPRDLAQAVLPDLIMEDVSAAVDW